MLNKGYFLYFILMDTMEKVLICCYVKKYRTPSGRLYYFTKGYRHENKIMFFSIMTFLSISQFPLEETLFTTATFFWQCVFLNGIPFYFLLNLLSFDIQITVAIAVACILNVKLERSKTGYSNKKRKENRVLREVGRMF
ncbi:hypothetical protein XELAEV_18034906mg [Xenopus laevis]|uniref:Uncharacterized protein n=1 Tax=Xenopus laevis TaxID=8355 RepID=A0A974HBJ4_XENLA|nr:hypothetical protein XELAEV_18034906mg [Xenopus laevis]